VTTTEPEQRALKPLWMLATGAAIGASAAASAELSASPLIGWTLVCSGLLFGYVALHHLRWWPLWLAAGCLSVGGRAVQVHIDHVALGQLLERNQEITVRARMTTVEGWVRSRWGWRTRVTAVRALHGGRPLRIPHRSLLEVRGTSVRDLLPAPGATVEALVRIRDTTRNPLLVASSSMLLESVRRPHGIGRVRDRLAHCLLQAAGTDVGRIRAAELAATLSLGRRDLMPKERRDGWRSSGLAHMLAVSGLHVGLLGAAVWVTAVAAGARPVWARICVMLALPLYALLAGASPSSVRAALMGMVYIGARLLGRALIPMAAVLVAATVMLFTRPDLVGDVGFQLTVLITAALVRWVPSASKILPGPRWLSGAFAVPIVAQLAAAPIVAWHFRTAVPGAAASNLLIPLLLAPALVIALGATTIASVWPSFASLMLEGLTLLERLLWVAGSPGRALEVVLPGVPAAAIAVLIVCGWTALQPGARARFGAASWVATLVTTAIWWGCQPAPKTPRVELLPVADGLAAVVADGSGVLLVDGGRRPDEAAHLLAGSTARVLSTVVVSHTDEDHLGGVQRVVASTRVRSLMIPSWMLVDPAAVPLLRTARRRGVDVIPVTRGSARRQGSTDIEVIWPPAAPSAIAENERSLVLRLRQPSGVVLITSDIGSSTEFRLSRLASLACHILITPHHGSRGSCSSALLSAAGPEVALIPAGPQNIHNHPHPEVLQRLEARAIEIRYPARDGLCGALFRDGGWCPFP
jgi:competence protein ComEC